MRTDWRSSEWSFFPHFLSITWRLKYSESAVIFQNPSPWVILTTICTLTKIIDFEILRNKYFWRELGERPSGGPANLLLGRSLNSRQKILFLSNPYCQIECWAPQSLKRVAKLRLKIYQILVFEARLRFALLASL